MQNFGIRDCTQYCCQLSQDSRHKVSAGSRQSNIQSELPAEPVGKCSIRHSRLVADRCQGKRHRKRTAVAANVAWPNSLQALAEATLARDIAASIFSAIASLLLVKTFNFLQRSGALEQKVSRKMVHILAGPGLLLCWPLFSVAPYARYFAALVPALNMFRLIAIGTGFVKDRGTVMAVSREGNRRELLRGPLYYVLALIAVTLLFWRQSPIGITAVALLCGGDGLADLVGRRFGSVKLPYNKDKSWAGSLAMFLGGWGLALGFIALFDYFGLFECTVSAIAGSVAIIAAAATFMESLPINRVLDDNLSIPLLAAGLGQYLFASSVILLA